MFVWLLIGVYALGYICTVRLIVWYTAKKWPTLGWNSGDTVFSIFFATLWPISIWIIGVSVYRMLYPAKPSASFLARMYDRDRLR